MRWILQWLAARSERRRLRQRALFQFRDGTRTRYADPAMVWRALLNHPKYDFASVSKLASEGHPDESRQLLEIIRDAFSVRPWSESDRTGLTEWETLALLQLFDLYVAALKKNTSLSPMPLPLSAYGRSISHGRESGETPDDPTNSSSASSSTSIESSTGGDTASSDPSPTA